MKKSEIKAGSVYSNGKEGRYKTERKILDIDNTGKYKLYDSQENCVTVHYEIIKGYSKGLGRMTLIRFANWAKHEVRE